MNKEQLIEKIRQSTSLDEITKEAWVKRIQTEGLTRDVLDDVRSELREKIETAFDEAGLTLDEDDPAYKKELNKMKDEIADAQQQFGQTIQQLQKQANTLQNKTANDLDKLQAQAIKETM